jgi:hypothetical protein
MVVDLTELLEPMGALSREYITHHLDTLLSAYQGPLREALEGATLSLAVGGFENGITAQTQDLVANIAIPKGVDVQAARLAAAKVFFYGYGTGQIVFKTAQAQRGERLGVQEYQLCCAEALEQFLCNTALYLDPNFDEAEFKRANREQPEFLARLPRTGVM